VRGFAAGAKPLAAGGSVDARTLGSERPDARTRSGSRTATCCPATAGCCLLLGFRCLVSVCSVLSVVPFCCCCCCCCRRRTTTENTESTEQRRSREKQRRAGPGRTTGGAAAERGAAV